MMASPGLHNADSQAPVPRCPCVGIAVVHEAMRAFIVDLVAREGIVPIAISEPDRLVAVLAASPVELLVVDGASFPECCPAGIGDLALERVIVIGAEPDAAYELAARRQGAGAWVPRDRVADDLPAALHRLLEHAQPLRVPREEPAP